MPEVEGPLESSFWLLVSSLQPLLSVLREEHSIFRGKKKLLFSMHEMFLFLSNEASGLGDS